MCYPILMYLLYMKKKNYADRKIYSLILIIMSHYQYGYFWPSLATHPNRPLLSAAPTSRICTGLLYVGSSWRTCLCSSLWRCPQEYITYELVPTSPGRVQYCSQHSCVFAVVFFSPFVWLASMWCIHIAISIRPLLGRSCVSFYRSRLTSIRPVAYR